MGRHYPLRFCPASSVSLGRNKTEGSLPYGGRVNTFAKDGLGRFDLRSPDRRVMKSQATRHWIKDDSQINQAPPDYI